MKLTFVIEFEKTDNSFLSHDEAVSYTFTLLPHVLRPKRGILCCGAHVVSGVS